MRFRSNFLKIFFNLKTYRHLQQYRQDIKIQIQTSISVLRFSEEKIFLGQSLRRTEEEERFAQKELLDP